MPDRLERRSRYDSHETILLDRGMSPRYRSHRLRKSLRGFSGSSDGMYYAGTEEGHILTRSVSEGERPQILADASG